MEGKDGAVIIEAKLDIENIDKGIQEIEKKLRKLSDKARAPHEVDGVTVTGGWQLGRKEQAYYDRLLKTLNKLRDKRQEIEEQNLGFFGQVNKASELSNQLDSVVNQYGKLKAKQLDGFVSEKEISKMNDLSYAAENLGNRINNLTEGQTVNTQAVLQEEEEIAKLNNELSNLLLVYEELGKQKVVSSKDIKDMAELKSQIKSTRSELEKLTGQRIYIDGIDKANHSLKKIENSSNRVLRTIKRWGLALVGVRSTYYGVRRIMSSVLSNNEKLSQQYSALGKSFAGAFEPIVKKIINLFRTLMAYANYVWKTLFGKNLFKSVVDSSDKTSKNLASGAKSAKEINKQLASFDEANVLSANNNSGGGAGVGTGDTGTVNLKFADVKIPDWLKKITGWIKDHPELTKILLGTAAFTILGGWLANNSIFDWVGKLLGKPGTGEGLSGANGLLGLLSSCLKLAAIGVITIEVIYLKKVVDEIIKGNNEIAESQDRMNENTKHNIKTTKDTIKTMQEKIKTGKVENDEIKKYTNWIKNKIKMNNDSIESDNLTATSIINVTSETMELINAYKDLYESGVDLGDQEYEYYKFLRDDLNGQFDLTTQKGVELAQQFQELDKKYNTKYNVEMTASGMKTVEGAVKGVSDKFSNFFKKLGSAIDLFNKYSVFKPLGSWLSKKFEVIFRKNGGVTNGIVNYPGRGVPINVAGEVSREGIIPMDNEAQMDLLGRSIAKYVNITNYVSNYMDSRKINTLLEESKNKERLASNGVR